MKTGSFLSILFPRVALMLQTENVSAGPLSDVLLSSCGIRLCNSLIFAPFDLYCFGPPRESGANSLWDRDMHFQMEESSPNYSWCSCLISLPLSFSLSVCLSLLQAGSCHKSLTALSRDKWLFKYGALFNTHRCSFNHHPARSCTCMLQILYVNPPSYTHTHTHTPKDTQLNTQHLLGSETLSNATDVTQMFSCILRLQWEEDLLTTSVGFKVT